MHNFCWLAGNISWNNIDRTGVCTSDDLSRIVRHIVRRKRVVETVDFNSLISCNLLLFSQTVGGCCFRHSYKLVWSENTVNIYPFWFELLNEVFDVSRWIKWNGVSAVRVLCQIGESSINAFIVDYMFSHISRTIHVHVCRTE